MEEALIAHLLGDSALTAVVGTRIHPVSIPQASLFPAIAVTRIDGAPLYADEGEVGLADPRIHIDCWGATYKDVKLIARKVVSRMNGLGLFLVNGVQFRSAILEVERDFREEGTNAAEYRYRVNLDFVIWHERN